MQTKRKHEGYLLIDHRASPGAGGLPGGAVFESATVTCSHCQVVVILNPNRTRPRGYCRKCDHYVCDKPECNRDCNGSFNKVLDDAEAEIRRKEASAKSSLILPSTYEVNRHG